MLGGYRGSNVPLGRTKQLFIRWADGSLRAIDGEWW